MAPRQRRRPPVVPLTRAAGRDAAGRPGGAAGPTGAVGAAETVAPAARAGAGLPHGRQGYFPKSGSRFSTKASRPSWPSSVM